jgi:Ca-activated chloride channel family protein
MILELLSAFHFLRPAWLLLLAPGLGLWWLLRQREDTIRNWRQVIAPALLAHLTLAGRQGGRLRPVDELLLVWLIGIIAASGPSWSLAPSIFAEDAPPVMILLQVTPSMLAQDVAPSRAARAAEKVTDLLNALPNQSAGLIAYSGSAHLVLPPTHDASVIETMAQALAPDEMPVEGNNLSGAVALATHVLAANGRGGGILIIADNAAAGDLLKLNAMARPPFPVTVLNIRKPGSGAPPALQRAVKLLDGRLIAVTVNGNDITALARHLSNATGVSNTPGEDRHWQDNGWYLTPLMGLLMLAWFRRGWEVRP